jgi:hypothetical protein
MSIGGNIGGASSGSLSLNIWWNLNMLRDTLKGGEQPDWVLSPAGLSPKPAKPEPQEKAKAIERGSNLI